MRAPAQSKTLQVLWDVEARGALGERTFTRHGLSMWAYVRWVTALHLGDRFYGSNLRDLIATAPPTRRDRVRYVAEALARHPRWRARREFPILFVSSSVGCYPRGGVQFNRLTDHFAGCFPDDTLVVEHSDQYAFHLPRHHPHVTHHDGLLVEAAIEGALRGPSADDRRRIDAFVAELRGLLGEHVGDDYLALARNQLVKAAARADAWRRGYHALLDRVRPRLLLVEDASYGGYAHLVRWARERGIAVAEYQHGYIGNNHEAYNYAPALLAGAYRANLPDHFLSYGPHWSAQINLPAEMVQIGNPHLTEQCRGLARTRHERAVLFVSGALDVPFYRRELPRIAAGLPPGVTLRFRPHPEERPIVQQRYGDLLARHRIVVDTEPLAYQSVLDADLVIGDASTLLFEADALGRPVVLLDYEQSHKAIPPGTFPYVDDWSSLPRRIEAGVTPTGTARPELWTPGWEQNYRNFVRRIAKLG